jgi:hypothetical protein
MPHLGQGYRPVDTNNHGEDVWSVGAYRYTGAKLNDSNPVCMTGVDADECCGVDVKCDPLGQEFHLQREKDNALRIIWDAQTWMAKMCGVILQKTGTCLILLELIRGNERQSVF